MDKVDEMIGKDPWEIDESEYSKYGLIFDQNTMGSNSLSAMEAKEIFSQYDLVLPDLKAI